jgi:hypothetical protein
MSNPPQIVIPSFVPQKVRSWAETYTKSSMPLNSVFFKILNRFLTSPKMKHVWKVLQEEVSKTGKDNLYEVTCFIFDIRRNYKSVKPRIYKAQAKALAHQSARYIDELKKHRGLISYLSRDNPEFSTLEFTIRRLEESARNYKLPEDSSVFPGSNIFKKKYGDNAEYVYYYREVSNYFRREFNATLHKVVAHLTNVIFGLPKPKPKNSPKSKSKTKFMFKGFYSVDDIRKNTADLDVKIDSQLVDEAFEGETLSAQDKSWLLSVLKLVRRKGVWIGSATHLLHAAPMIGIKGHSAIMKTIEIFKPKLCKIGIVVDISGKIITIRKKN